MYLLNWLIFINILLLLSSVALLILFIFLIIYIYEKIQDKIIIVKLIGLIFVFLLALIANHYWCYLALILLIAANFGLINNDVLEALRACFNKSPNVNPFKNDEQRQKRQESEDKKAKVYENEIKSNEDISKSAECQNDSNSEHTPDVKDTSCKQYRRAEILSKYKDTEDNVISWFAYTYNLNFDKNMVVTAKNKHSMYPDGISQTKNKDTILEVKLVKNQINIPSTIMHTQKLFLEYNQMYKTSNKALEFVLAIVADSFNEDTFKLSNEYINKNPNIKIYIFTYNNGVLQKKKIL